MLILALYLRSASVSLVFVVLYVFEIFRYILYSVSLVN